MATATKARPKKAAKARRTIPAGDNGEAMPERDGPQPISSPDLGDDDELQADDVPLDTNEATDPAEASDVQDGGPAKVDSDATPPADDREPIIIPDPIDAGELLELIEAAEVAVEEAAREVASRKDDLKEAKEVLAGKIADLRRIARRRKDRERQIEFAQDQARRREEAKARNDANRPLLNPSANGHASGDDTWRAVPLDSLFEGAVLKALKESGLESVGSLADYTASEKRLTDLKGIGEAKAEEVEARMERFWAERN